MTGCRCVLGTVLVASVMLAGACTTAREPVHDARPGAAAADDELGSSSEPAQSSDALAETRECRSGFSPADVAGFVQEWFGALAALQLTVDVNPVRQLLNHPDGSGLDELRAMHECSSRILVSFGDSTDARIRDLARGMISLLAEAAKAEQANSALFRSTDWSAYASNEEKARRWGEIRPSTRRLSERGAALTERIVALLREDGRVDYGPGRLRITRAEREVALRHRSRLSDLARMVERGIDAGQPLSMTARKVVKWLYHGHGLTYAERAPGEGLDLPRPAG